VRHMCWAHSLPAQPPPRGLARSSREEISRSEALHLGRASLAQLSPMSWRFLVDESSVGCISCTPDGKPRRRIGISVVAAGVPTILCSFLGVSWHFRVPCIILTACQTYTSRWMLRLYLVILPRLWMILAQRRIWQDPTSKTRLPQLPTTYDDLLSVPFPMPVK
jgi:hypothetical protein